MKLKGGYNIILKGKPDGEINIMPEAKELYLPLRSDRFEFSEICVKDGKHVRGGDTLATDPNNHSVPLLAPRAGRVRLDKAEGHIVLEDVAESEEETDFDETDLPHIAQQMGVAGMKRYKMLTMGAWEFMYDAYTGALPDPLGTPQAVIVSTVSLEPFAVRGDVLLHRRLLNFTRGLEQLQSLLEYQPMYLVLPDVKSDFATLVRNQIRGYAFAKLVEIPLKYGLDNFAVLARRLGLKRSNGPIWTVRTEGVLAIDRALTLSKPCLVRVISIGGSGVHGPTHIKVMPGYPVKQIMDKYAFEPVPRILNGGALTGKVCDEKVLGLDVECRGLTVLPELEEREFLGFARPGWGRKSYAACYLSSLRVPFSERFTTGVHGEERPCISCNFCEEVCPAGIMPHLIHKYLYGDLIEEVEQARLDLCVECGLCSFVCPSKLDLRQQFIDAKVLIEQEKEAIRQEEARRAEEEARRAALEENSE